MKKQNHLQNTFRDCQETATKVECKYTRNCFQPRDFPCHHSDGRIRPLDKLTNSFARVASLSAGGVVDQLSCGAVIQCAKEFNIPLDGL